MKLIKANINNFGKLHDVEINFEQNLNSFLHENGWGKTTLSIFIMSMFYGMEYTSSKDLTKNEKLKYLPWQGGTYGGSLCFSHNGKEYRVTRTFGLKKGEDTFELLDLKTNKISNDYTSDLGTEIFGIGRETYGRSVHVTLDETPVGANDISAKLNNLVEAGDVANFDKAVEILEKNASAIKAKRGKNDELNAIQDKISENRESLADIESRLKQNVECEKRINGAEKEISDLKNKQEEITEQLSNSAKYESKIRYEQLKLDVQNAENAKTDLEEFFNGKVPTSEMISNIDAICSNFSTVESNIKTQSATQSQKNDYEQLQSYFGGDVPTEQQIADCIKADNDYKSFKQMSGSLKLTSAEQSEFESLKNKYENGQISLDIIENHMKNVEAVQNKKSELANKKTELSNAETRLQIEQSIKTTNVKRIVLIVAGILVLLAGVAALIFKLFPIGVAGILIGAALNVFGVLSKSKKQESSLTLNTINSLKIEIDRLESEITATENQYKVFISKFAPNATSELMALSSISSEYGTYERLSNKNKEYLNWLSNQKNPEEYENLLKVFVQRYCKTDDISSVSTLIQILNEKIKKLESLEKIINADSNNDKAFSEHKEKLDSILGNYQTDKTKSYSEQVQQLHEKITTLKNSDLQIQEAKKRLSDFEKDPANDISAFENLVKPEKSVDELQQAMSVLADEVNERNKTVSTYKKIIDDNLTFTDKKEDIETEIETLSIKKQEKTEENEMLLKTIELLKKAKENLDANYSDPMKEGFNKYIKMLGGNLNLIINTDLEVSVDDNGQIRESEYLSEGYKDMVNFCSRMALVDALFKEVNPPVILDDPFVNLDDDKVPNALKLVKEMSKEKQILYFACHKSRSVE